MVMVRDDDDDHYQLSCVDQYIAASRHQSFNLPLYLGVPFPSTWVFFFPYILVFYFPYILVFYLPSTQVFHFPFTSREADGPKVSTL